MQDSAVTIQIQAKYVFATTEVVVCLNVILLCVCFRPAKYPPHYTATRIITPGQLAMLVTIAATGQQEVHTQQLAAI